MNVISDLGVLQSYVQPLAYARSDVSAMSDADQKYPFRGAFAASLARMRSRVLLRVAWRSYMMTAFDYTGLGFALAGV
jgi:hypothetical protein